MTTRIDYALLDLDLEKPTQSLESFLELSDKYLYWKARYYADVPINPEDPNVGWFNKMKSYQIWVRRGDISSVGVSYMFRRNVWQVFIDSPGLAGTIDIVFKRESEAQAMAAELIEWIWPR